MDNKTIRFKKILSVTFIILIMYLLIASAYNYLAKIGAAINLDDANVPLVLLKADNCNSPYVENEIVSIFKENDTYFKYLDTKSIDVINILDKKTLMAGERGEKYLCSGIIEITSDRKGFRPNIFDDDNLFYNQIYLQPNKQKITRFTLYRSPITYSTKITNGNHSVELNEIISGDFNCKDVCKSEYLIKNVEEKPVVKSSNIKQKIIYEETPKKQKKFLSIFNKNAEKQKENSDADNIKTVESQKSIETDTKKGNRFINFFKRKIEDRKKKKAEKLILKLKNKDKE